MKFSEEFERQLAGLRSRQQQVGALRMIRVLGEGGSIRSLITGPDKICAWATYYKRTGWAYQDEFQAVVKLGLEEYRAGKVEAVGRAAEVLRGASVEAAELSRAIVRGVLGGDMDGVPPAVRELVRMLVDEDARDSDRVSAGRVLLNQGLRSAMTILDRADVETAVKEQSGDMARVQEWVEALRDAAGAGDESGQMADVGAEAGDVPAAGV